MQASRIVACTTSTTTHLDLPGMEPVLLALMSMHESRVKDRVNAGCIPVVLLPFALLLLLLYITRFDIGNVQVWALFRGEVSVV